MRQPTCAGCMWWWDLYDTDERICYLKDSPMFHKPSKNRCPKYETLIRKGLHMNLGKYKSSKKED